MNDARATFEEIWPVPEQIEWSADRCAYWTEQYGFMLFAAELNLRLDTFTRCQETTDVYVSLISEMVDELSQDQYPGDWYYRAKQIMEQKK